MSIQHIYTTFLYKTSSGVAGLPNDNDDNLADFESHKSSATAFDNLEYSDIVFYHELSYSDFKDKVVLWSSVKYRETDVYYQLVIIENETI